LRSGRQNTADEQRQQWKQALKPHPAMSRPIVAAALAVFASHAMEPI
jgi:hypothetical protein